ncbi:MAG: hypothetical protein V1866_06025 [archaeon]
MRKITILPILVVAFVLLVSTFASAVRFDVQAARQEEWDSYQQYKKDYVEVNDLEGYEKYLSERNLQREFGFYGPMHYYISPQVLAAKYNPPLQGEVYQTDTRGVQSSLQQPSAVKFYGEKLNGKYVGAVPSTLNGVYFDHPQANAVIGYETIGSYGGYGAYNGYAGYDGYAYPGAESPRYYARVASQVNNDFYIVGFY